jgi:hypothetical protein
MTGQHDLTLAIAIMFVSCIGMAGVIIRALIYLVWGR